MAFHYTIKEIAAMCDATVKGSSHNNKLPLSHIITDSRTNVIAGESIFFALKGERHDGHHFISELANRGVNCFVVEATPEVIDPSLTFLIVPDTLKALQIFASRHRSKFNIPVAGITGSNGKTIVKEWLAQLLTPEHRTLRSPLSYNSQIGVPLSVLQLDNSYDIAIFEAGISRPAEMEKLREIIRPEFGIFTGIGPAHDENFTSREQKIQEKLKLFINCKQLVMLCEKGGENLRKTVAGFTKKHNIRLFTIGKDIDCSIVITELLTGEQNIRAKLRFETKSFEVIIPFRDEPSVKNSLVCIATMILLGYNPDDISRKIGRLEPVAMRMQQIEGIQNCVIINDSYNNDLLALKMALDHLQNNNSRERKCLILSDIFQSGLDAQTMLKQLAGLINNYRPDKFIGIGKAMAGLQGRINCKTWFYGTTEDFIRYHPMSGFRDEVILLKGARSFQFERIRDVLQRQSHGTVMEINLEALVHNLNYYRSQVSNDTHIMAMVKAASYGGGSFEIASVLQYQKVSYLAVAYTDEGVELRKAGIRMPIMVMNPEPASFDLMIENFLEPEIYSFSVLSSFIRSLEAKLPYNAPPYPVHIEVDTGMHRLGFDTGEISSLISLLNSTRSLKVASVFSHLATADDKANTEFAVRQITLFKIIRQQFLDELTEVRPLFHILNSAGIINFPDAQFDMVRPGIGLYGIASDPVVQKKLRNVGTLKSVISQIKRVNRGESVGYNRAFIAPEDIIIAIVAIGYADGYNRKLGNGAGSVSIKGLPANVVGDVCMDMIMVDITNIPDVIAGDEVVVFNDSKQIAGIANKLDTIPYEVLTSVSSRVKRVYLTE